MLYVNARFLTQKTTGVQRFAQEISHQLSKLRDDVIFLVPNDCIEDREIYNTLNIQVLRGMSGHFWEQYTLPSFLKKNGKPLLLNLCNTAPIFYRNQIVTHHDITYIRHSKSFPKKFVYLYKTLTPFMLWNSKKILTVSEFSKKEIAEHYNCENSKIEVIYNAVNSNFKPGYTAELVNENYLLAVSSPALHKNFNFLIENFIRSKLDIKLKIIGSASGTFNKVNYLSSDRVEFLGRVSDRELVRLYQNAKAFLFPSLYEGFGIPPLEAQACGCPVISSNRASMSEVLGDSAAFFDPYSASEFINCLEDILNSETKMNDLKIKGFKNYKRFSWLDSATKVNGLITGILKSEQYR